MENPSHVVVISLVTIFKVSLFLELEGESWTSRRHTFTSSAKPETRANINILLQYKYKNKKKETSIVVYLSHKDTVLSFLRDLA